MFLTYCLVEDSDLQKITLDTEGPLFSVRPRPEYSPRLFGADSIRLHAVD
jgi:hypothetical protein